MKSAGMRIRKPKERGEWAELRFMAKAAELGFKLSKPWGDSAPYDVAIEHRGHFLRVQVKSTMCQAVPRKPHHQKGVFVANMRHIWVRRYQPSDFDYVAVSFDDGSVVRTPLHDRGGGCGVGVLRLRSCFASAKQLLRSG